MCLTKGILGVLLLFIAILFLAWDSPKELRSPYLWGGILLGSIPVVGWYGLQWQLSGESFVQVTLLAQNFGRIWDDEGKTGPPWYYLLELLKYSWPWLIFWPTGIWLTWKNRNYTWAKLLLVWTVVFFVTISVMGTKLPWYVYPIYPALACTMGVTLTAAWNIHRHWNDRSLSFKRLPRAWGYLLGLFSVIGAAGVVYASPWGGEPSLALVLTFFTLMVATGLAALFVLSPASPLHPDFDGWVLPRPALSGEFRSLGLGVGRIVPGNARCQSGSRPGAAREFRLYGQPLPPAIPILL